MEPLVSARISILLWADILVGYALFVMQDYLTSVWNLSFTHAAGIINVWTGITMVLPAIFLFLVDAFLGNVKMLVISSISYSVGIGLVTLSTPPVLGGSCRRYEEECIGQKQKALFYAGMSLIAVGVAGNKVSVKPLIAEHELNREGQSNPVVQLVTLSLVVIGALVGAIGLPYVKPWKLRFGIPAICTVAATAVFLISGLVKRYRTSRGWGAIGSVGGWSLFATMPIWLTFVVCGVISSVENSYFVEQASHLDRHIGKWDAPLQVFMLASQCSKLTFGFIRTHVIKRCVKSWKLGIGVAMVLSVLCCITAAEVERRRLGVVRRHGLLDKPDDGIPMSIYWLAFQFVLLAGSDLFLEKSVKSFCTGGDDEDEESGFVVEHFTNFVTGLGNVLGVLTVYVVGKISESGGRRENWFQPTLNESRLDRYYWVLAGLGGVDFLVFAVVACFYKN